MQQAWKERFKRWLVPMPDGSRLASSAPPGMYHYQQERDGEYIRFHLRVEPSGEALLIAGASEVARLSRSGAVAAKSLLETDDREAVVAKVKPHAAQALYREVILLLDELGGPSSRFPIFNLPDPIDSTRDARLIAPFQADVEITQPNQLQAIFGRLWDAGIPHVRLLHNETIDTQQLVRAVEHAEDIGMIAGVRAWAGWLHDDDRIKQLAEVGLDYIICPWGVTSDLHGELFSDQDFAALPNVISQILEWEMTPVFELPLVPGTVDALPDSLQQLTDWSITHVECYALVTTDTETASASRTTPFRPAELKQVATFIEELPDGYPLRAIWLPPLVCHAGDSVRDKIHQGARAGGDIAIYVDANGDVFPPRGPRTCVGNLLNESWQQIWKDEAFRRFRKYVEANTRCEQCPGLAICAADCPSEPQGWADDR